MGKSIDLSQPLSDEDRAWLQERGAYGNLRVADELARIAAGDFDSVAAEEVPVQEDDDDTVVESESYGSWTNAQLRYELSTRDLPQYGTKAELVSRLEEHDSETGQAPAAHDEDTDQS